PKPAAEAAPAPAPAEAPAGTPDVGEAFGQLSDAFGQFVQAMPQWAVIGIAVVVAVGVGVLIGARLNRGGAAPKTSPAPPPKPMLPAPENPAVTAYKEFLEEKGVSAGDQDSRIREFAQAFKDMRLSLRDLIPGDPDLDGHVEAAREALSEGKFADAVSHLHKIGDAEHRDGVEAQNASLKSLMAAATAKEVAGDLHMAQMEYAAAAGQFEQAADALPAGNDERRAEILNKHGTAAYQAGEHAAAITSFEKSLDLLQRHLGKNHPDVAAALNNLALLHYSRGQYEAAEPLYQRSLKIDEQTLGADHPGVATDLNNLALLYKKTGNLEAAEPLLKRALEIKEKNFDPGHPSLVTGLKNYASVLRALGRDGEAEPYEKRATVLPPATTRAAE
ncbi:MAG: tetratricopeptide repeat protein, partial [Magnetovibrio sp.]|nr:tetratricopeptide repeat protein [Magnetovibrio sp.]